MKLLSIPAYALQRVVEDFTLSQRYWTAYPAHKIEHILRFYHILPDGWYYRTFDSSTESAIFAPGGSVIADEIEKHVADNLKKFMNTDDLVTEKLDRFLSSHEPTDDSLLLSPPKNDPTKIP